MHVLTQGAFDAGQLATVCFLKSKGANAVLAGYIQACSMNVVMLKLFRTCACLLGWDRQQAHGKSLGETFLAALA